MKKIVLFVVCLIGLAWIGSKPSNASKAQRVQEVVKAKDITLSDLLFYNPASAVSQQFAPKVASGEIVLMERRLPGVTAAFMLWPVEKLSSKPVGEIGWMPVLVTDPTTIADSTQLVRNKLVIFHEYIHYRQAMSGKIAAEAFYPKFAEEYPNQRKFICEQKWYAEVEAYQKECELAKLMKTSVVDEFCVGFGTPKFEQNLIRLMMKRDPSAETCKDVFAKIVPNSTQ